MAKKSFTVDQTLFRAQTQKLVRQLKLDESTVVREQGGLLATLLAKMTPPFKTFPKMQGKPVYTTGGALGIGKAAVKKDFFRSIKLMGTEKQWNDKGMKAAIVRGDTDYLQKRLTYMKGSVKQGLRVRHYNNGIRDAQRNTRGRINTGTQPIVMMNSPLIKKGLDRALNNVGIAKASFALAALRLGRPAPKGKWISKHFSKVNTPVSVSRNPARVRFTSSAKGLDVVSRKLKAIERFRMVAMVKRLESLVRADAKKAGFKTR